MAADPTGAADSSLGEFVFFEGVTGLSIHGALLVLRI
jgi:hypothetical protein